MSSLPLSYTSAGLATFFFISGYTNEELIILYTVTPNELTHADIP